MTGARRVTANQANAKRSTGPKTPAGKFRSARNAVRHGLTATTLDEQSRSEIATLVARYLEITDNQPAAEAAAEARVQLSRVQLAKVHALQQAEERILEEGEKSLSPSDVDAQAFLSALPDLRKLSEYERRARSRLKSAIREL